MATSIQSVTESATSGNAPASAETGTVADAGIPPCRIETDSPQCYLNRELTWLEFNRRVLHMAEDEHTPLLERVKFLAIVSSNIDEFFMKRIGGLKQQIAAGIRTQTIDGRTPQEQVVECQAVVRDIHRRQKIVLEHLRELLKQHDIRFVPYTGLRAEEQASLREHFSANIFPLLTPLAMDPGHPFPFISNLALNLLVTVRYPGGSATHLARVKVPISGDVAPRFIRVGQGNTFVMLEDVITANMDMLFPGMEIVSCELFRVTRNAVVEVDEEEADDLLNDRVGTA
jgi:polyphosphate kinase